MLKSSLILALAGLTSFSTAAPLTKRGGGGGGGKRGLAYGKANPGTTHTLTGPKVTWAYNWEAQVLGDFNPDLEFVVMFHDPADVFVKSFGVDTPECIAKWNTKHVLSFNEPDHCGPANEGGTCLDFGTAADKHKELIQPFAEKNPDIKIGSVSVTNGGEDNKGMKYLEKFMGACSDCKIDFYTAHWQSPADIEGFKNYWNGFHEKFNDKPVWITEWHPTDGPNEDFMQKAMDWMDSQDWIERYAYWSVDDSLAPGGAISPLGQKYISG